MRILCLVVFGLLTFLPTGWDLSLFDGQDELSSNSQDEPKDPKPNLPHQKIVKEFSELGKEYKHDMSRSAGKATKNTTENIRAEKNEEISETNKVKVKERKHRKSQDTHEGKPRKVKILKRIGKLFMKERKEKKKRKERYKLLYRKRKQKRNKWRRNKNRPKQCDSDVENECLQAAMDVYEFQRRNIFFFKRQDKIYSFIATIVKKLERKDDFGDIAKHLQVSIGGDIKNPNCRESDAANKVRIEKYVLNNYTTLLNCEADIQSKCTITNAVWDKDTKDQLDKCVCRLNKKPSKDCHEVFIDSEACKCWKTQKDNKYPGARECTDKSAETLKGITYIKKMCTAALVKCKDALNAAGSLIETCLVGEVRDNKGESETFEEFVVKYGKNYMPIEKLQRFAIWKRNTKATEKHNQDVSKTYRRSENFMSDMRLSEIKTRYMGLTPKVPCYLLNVKLTRLPMRSPLPRNIDWVNKGAVTQVQLQEGGTCWAHSAVGALEGVYHSTNTHSTTNGPTTNGPTTNRPAIEISVDYLIQCDTDGKNSKNQGNPIYAFTHVFNNGIPTKSEYDNEPSTTSGSGLSTLSSSIEASCGVEKSVKIKRVSVYEGTENNIKSALQIGPVSAVMCATETFINHKGSDIFEEQNCLDKCLTIKNHAVLIVGYGGVGDDRYWYVKNSWGTSWGDQGYFKISREESKDCGIISVTSRPIIGETYIKCNTDANPDIFATVDEALNVTCCGQGNGGTQQTCSTPEACKIVCGSETEITCYAPSDSPDAAECSLYDDPNLVLVGWGRWPCKRANCPSPACNNYSVC